MDTRLEGVLVSLLVEVKAFEKVAMMDVETEADLDMMMGGW